MKFCTECGKPNPEEADFCSNCGKTFQVNDAQQTANPTSPPPVAASVVHTPTVPPKKPMKKSSKIMLILAGLVAIGLISTHFILQNMYDPMKKIDSMNTAYNNQDHEAFFKQFTLKKGTIASADNFYALVSEYGWKDLRNELTYEAEKIKNKKPADMIYDTGEFISITKKPVVLGLYQDVNFTILPTAVTVTPPLGNTTFHFGGEEITAAQAEESVLIGQFIPGEYKWSFESTGGFMPLAGKGTYTLTPDESNRQQLDIDWDFTTLYLDSDLEDATVYINGTSTKKKVSELSEIYPAQLNKSIKIQAVSKDKDGKEVKSSEVPADSDEIYLAFEHVQQEQQLTEEIAEVEDFYKGFRSDYEDAIYYADFSYIENYFKPGSVIRKDYAKFVSDHSTIPGYFYEFLLNDVTSVTPQSSGSFELLSYEKFNYSSYEDSPLRYDRKKKYVISKVNGDYVIDAIIDLDTKKTKY
ncbi:zinc-ribbon domain-containing protein [Sporosarcina sp. BI001-red]|uniref:TcaA NTF2-like domain-containing protein n=1 Tax=Sporosarcina sp. BI001-red TaxID=2282866 RepID=UPI000E224F53|nr:zinc-ribbon domain-containing protein [Sporosarcina sp. BI001-red]REB08549.1 zinc-ribbon domain-containing protein [Sporosarcina sp. BI001-red]